MDKLLIIEGDNDILIEKEINKLLKKLQEDYDLIKFDLENNLIEDVIEALDTYDMFFRKKVVVLLNPIFLNNKMDDTFNQQIFLKYLENPSENILILVTDKINNRLKLTSTILKYFKIVKIKEVSTFDFVRENLEDYQMDNMTINYFLNKVGSNFQTIKEELQKLKSYTISTKKITKSDIDMISNQNIEATIFDLIDAIIKKDKKKSYLLYEHFINNGTEIFPIIIMLSNQIRLIYNVKILSNLSDSMIASKLGVKEYPVKLARGKGYSYTKRELLYLLKELATIDEDIKSGKQLPNICFLSFVRQM